MIDFSHYNICHNTQWMFFFQCAFSKIQNAPMFPSSSLKTLVFVIIKFNLPTCSFSGAVSLHAQIFCQHFFCKFYISYNGIGKKQ